MRSYVTLLYDCKNTLRTVISFLNRRCCYYYWLMTNCGAYALYNHNNVKNNKLILWILLSQILYNQANTIYITQINTHYTNSIEVFLNIGKIIFSILKPAQVIPRSTVEHSIISASVQMPGHFIYPRALHSMQIFLTDSTIILPWLKRRKYWSSSTYNSLQLLKPKQ